MDMFKCSKKKIIDFSHSLEMNDFIWCHRFDVNGTDSYQESEGIVYYLCSQSYATFTLSYGKQEAIQHIFLKIK